MIYEDHGSQASLNTRASIRTITYKVSTTASVCMCLADGMRSAHCTSLSHVDRRHPYRRPSACPPNSNLDRGIWLIQDVQEALTATTSVCASCYTSSHEILEGRAFGGVQIEPFSNAPLSQYAPPVTCGAHRGEAQWRPAQWHGHAEGPSAFVVQAHRRPARHYRVASECGHNHINS